MPTCVDCKEKDTEIDELRATVEDLEDEVSEREAKVDDLEDALEARDHPEWGNCKRGCPPAYIDAGGFCSPACAMGGARGEHYTPVAPVAPVRQQMALGVSV